MKIAVYFPLVLAVVMVAACSKSPAQAEGEKPATTATTATAATAATQVNYKKICEHLVPLAPDTRKGAFASECEAAYKVYLPACNNAEAVTECFVKIKAWSERLACLDSCQRAGAPAK